MAKQFIILPNYRHEGYGEPDASFDELEQAVNWLNTQELKLTNWYDVFDTDSLKIVYTKE